MDPARWPSGIRDFVDHMGSKANGELIVEVEYQKPVWTVTLGCTCCGLTRLWKLVGETPVQDPDAIPVPTAFREMFA